MTVQRKRGPKIAGARRSDAALLHSLFRDRGLDWRGADAAVSALLGVGKGETSRGMRLDLLPRADPQRTLVQRTALGAQADFIAARLVDPKTTTAARAALNRLHPEERALIECIERETRKRGCG